MYAIIHDTIFDGSLRDKWQAWVVLVALCALADENDEVDMTISALIARTGLPGSIVPEGIAFLEQPDDHSRTPDEGGRRIVRLDPHRPWGWKIVNREKYKKMRDHVARREYYKEQKRLKRAEKKLSTTDVHSVHHGPPQAVGSRQEAEEEPRGVFSIENLEATSKNSLTGTYSAESVKLLRAGEAAAAESEKHKAADRAAGLGR